MFGVSLLFFKPYHLKPRKRNLRAKTTN